jgi:thiol:disulfide interchange protein DsbD
MRPSLRLLAALCVGAFHCLYPSALHAEKPDVRARVLAPAGAAAGSTATLVIEMTVGEGWHVNSHTPAEKFLIPTDVSLATTTGTLSSVRYPRQVEKRFAFSEKPMMVYEGTARFEADLTLPPGASGNATIDGSLSFQACNDRQCFPPAKILLKQSIAISPTAGSVSSR